MYFSHLSFSRLFKYVWVCVGPKQCEALSISKGFVTYGQCWLGHSIIQSCFCRVSSLCAGVTAGEGAPNAVLSGVQVLGYSSGKAVLWPGSWFQAHFVQAAEGAPRCLGIILQWQIQMSTLQPGGFYAVLPSHQISLPCKYLPLLHPSLLLQSDALVPWGEWYTASGSAALPKDIIELPKVLWLSAVFLDFFFCISNQLPSLVGWLATYRPI